MEENLCYVNTSRILICMICMSNRKVIKNQAFSIARKDLCRANKLKLAKGQ